MKVEFSKGTISYRVSGQGPAVVFLHGFMESARIWRAFAYKLSSRFRVIRINLPGHGGSSVFHEPHTMEFMATTVHAVLEKEKVEKAMLVGHSMGGYVALAFAEKWPEMLSGLVMFSSSSFGDSTERKQERDRAIKAAESHKMKYVTSVVPNLFFERTGNKAAKRIYKLVKLASAQSKEGIIAAIRGMKDRPDRSDTLRNASFPVLFLAGKHDPLLTVEKVEEMKNMNPGSTVFYLENSAHVGFIEQRKESMQAIRNFAVEKIL
jgi:pimeloyl-ACP methyl ester carboxylesterase